MSPMEVCEGLGLYDLKNRVWHIQGTCALKGDGLYEGLDWLASTLDELQASGRSTSVGTSFWSTTVSNFTVPAAHTVSCLILSQAQCISFVITSFWRFRLVSFDVCRLKYGVLEKDYKIWKLTFDRYYNITFALLSFMDLL